MAKAIRLLTVIDIFFILLLALSGTLCGPLGDVIYILAFAVPVFLGALGAAGLKEEREGVAGVREPVRIRLGLSSEGVSMLLPLVAPTVAIVFLLALVTSLALGALGAENNTVEVLPLWQMLIVNALLPAILEELAFRYVPLKLLLPYSPRAAVIISALYFAFIHCNLYQMPYAFAAGVIFAVIDIMCDSILPSVILHFLNNASSVLWIKYVTGVAEGAIYLSVLAVLVAVSLVFILRRKEKYARGIRAAFVGTELTFGYYPVMLAILSVGVAVTNLFI